MSNITRQDQIDQLITNQYIIGKVQESIFMLDLIDPVELLEETQYDGCSIESIASVSLNTAENILEDIKMDMELDEYPDDILVQLVAIAIAKLITKENAKHGSYGATTLKRQLDYMEENIVPTDVIHDAILNVLEERNQSAPGLK